MTVVFKLGGSLLTLPGLSETLQSVLKKRSLDPCLIVTGGGATADIVREWSQIHHLDDENAHWLAMSSTDLNRQFMERLMRYKSVNSQNDASAIWAGYRQPLLLQLTEFMRREESTVGNCVPHDWNVTSDSLAAWVALRWPAKELILLKSIPAPLGRTAEEAAAAGTVDKFFPMISNQLRRVSWCNLRASTTAIETWLASDIGSPPTSNHED